MLLFAVLVLIASCGQILAWGFSDIPPKPLLYDVLQPFWMLWVLWVCLLFPLDILSRPLKSIGIDVMSGHPLLFYVTEGVYFYLMSCLIVSLNNRFKTWKN